jgi:hypothetical protein
MEDNKMSYKKVFVLSIIVCGLFVSACSSKVSIRASDSMFKENPVKKIAVIAEGKVQWPGLGGFKVNPALLGLQESKEALATHLPQTKDVFTKKGYEVVFCEPTGIGYYSPFDETSGRWVVDYGEPTEPKSEENKESKESKETEGNKEAKKNTEKPNSKKWQIQGMEPAFEYPIVKNNPDLKKASKSIFEDFELSIYRRTINFYVPKKEDLKIIQNITNADTICVNRVFGLKYSNRRKIAAALLVGGGLSDTVESFFVCVNASTGEVLWQNGIYTLGDPTSPSETYIDNVLKLFPEINKPITAKCEKVKDQIYQCEPEPK